MNKSFLFFSLTTLIVLSGCTFKSAGTWKNAGIPEKVKTSIAPLDKKVLEGLQTDDAASVNELLSDDLKKMMGSKMDSVIHEMHQYIESADFRVMEQFYVKTVTVGTDITIKSDEAGPNEFNFTYTTRTPESFVSLLVPESKVNEILFTIVYGKTKEGWRINILKCGLLKMDNKTAPELYERAKKEYEKGYLADALNTMYMAAQTLAPGSDYLVYTQEKEIKKFGDKVLEEAKNTFSFPMTVPTIKSQPQLIGFSPQLTDEGYFPLVEYVSTLDLKDSVQIHIENDQIHAMIGEVFPGINKDKKYVFYKAHEMMPDGITEHLVYKFVQENNP